MGERDYPLNRMPGWNQNSCGYHADDGNLFHESGIGTTFGPTCTDGDRMGCGVDFSADSSSGYVNVFFTKNGKQVSWDREEERQERRGGRGVRRWKRKKRRRRGREDGEDGGLFVVRT